MQRVANHRFLYRRGATLYFRRAVPAEARAAFDGRTEIVASLKTGSLAEARPKWAALIADFEKRLAQGVSPPPASSAIRPDVEMIDEAVRTWHGTQYQQRALRDFGRDDPEVEERLQDGRRYEDTLIQTMRGGVNRRAPELQTEWIAEHLAASHQWTLERSDPLYPHLLSRVARAERDLERKTRSEVEFEPLTIADAFFSPAEHLADTDRQKRRRGGQSVPILQLFDAYVAEAELKPATQKAWRQCLSNLIAHLKHDDASRVTAENLIDWKEALAKEGGDSPVRGARTIRDKYLASAKALFRWAAANRKIEQNPTLGIGIRVKNRPQLRERGLSDKEAAIILSAALAYDDQAGLSLQAFARRWVPWLCAYTGARVGEITQLRAEDVLSRDGIAFIRITPEAGAQKENRAREVPLHSHLIRQGFVEAVRGKTGPLFFDPKNYRGGNLGNPQSRKVSERLARWVRRIGVDDPLVQPNHGWRHRFKTQARLVGMDPEARDTIQDHSRGTEGSKYGDTPLPALLRAIESHPVYAVDTP